jgi:aryl-alcohol dehydrogenase-like predicted oxidoreductase
MLRRVGQVCQSGEMKLLGSLVVGVLCALSSRSQRSLRFKIFANTVSRVDNLKKVLPEGMTPPEMALRFILSNPVVSTTIVGMRRPDHVRENLAVGDAGPLDAALLHTLRQHRWDRLPQPWSD